MSFRSVLIGVLVGLLLAGAAGGAYFVLGEDGKDEVDVDALADSLDAELSYPAVVSCEGVSERRWRCDVTGGEEPVVPEDTNCWDAAYSKEPDSAYWDWRDGEDPDVSPSGCLD